MTINSKTSLHASILELEQKKLQQEAALKVQYHITGESLKPVNLLKEGIGKLTHMPDTGGGLLKTAVGIGVAVLSKKLFIGKSSNIVKKLVGGIFELAVVNTTIGNADKVKAYGISLYRNLFKKRSNHKPTNEEI